MKRSLILTFLPLALMAQEPEILTAKSIASALQAPTSKAMDVRPSIALKVQFAFNASKLTDAGRAQLDELARALQSPELAGKRFALKGHTDGVGKPEYNLKLSNLRADAVKAYLMDRYGIDGARLEAKGYGATKLLLPDDPKNERNRRVEVEGLD